MSAAPTANEHRRPARGGERSERAGEPMSAAPTANEHRRPAGGGERSERAGEQMRHRTWTSSAVAGRGGRARPGTAGRAGGGTADGRTSQDGTSGDVAPRRGRRDRARREG